MDSTKGYDLSGADRTLKPRSESLGIADSQQQLEEEAQYDQASDVDTGSEMDVNTNENDRKDKKEHRLLVQALISAIIITICGFTTVMVHIASFIGFLAFQKRSLVTALLGLTNHLHFILLVCRVCAEILIVLGIFFIFAHRIIGFCLGYYLRSFLDPLNAGIFGFHFDWISLRVGLDSNMLVLHGFEWRNPPEFTNTPYFIRIEEVGFQIDATSAYNAVMHGASIRVHHIKLDGVELYIEKLSERSINRALERGLLKTRTTTEPSTLSTSAQKTEPAVADRSSVRLDRAESSSSDRSLSPLPASPAAKGTSSDKGSVGNTGSAGSAIKAAAAPSAPIPLKVGTLNLWACMGGTGTEAASEKLDVLSTIKNMGSSLTSTFRKTFSVSRKNKKSNSSATTFTGNSAVDGDEATPSDSDIDPEDGDLNDSSAHSNPQSQEQKVEQKVEETIEEAFARLQAEYPDLVLPPLPGDAYDPEDIQHHAEVRKAIAKETRREAQAREKREKDAWKGWGVPYLLEVDQLYVHDIRLHAHDFLNSKHTKEDKASVIKLKSFTMFREELTLSPDKKISKYRRGVYLDDLVWRLVNKLVKELLFHNSMAMMMILTSALATNTTSLATAGTASSAKLLNQAAATTSSSAKFALNKVGSVFSGNSIGASSASSSVASGATMATQSAMKVLSSTSANVSEGARSVVNSINPFAKRTTGSSSKQN